MTLASPSRHLAVVTILFVLVLVGLFALFFSTVSTDLSLETMTGRVVTVVNISGFFFVNCSTMIPAGTSYFSVYCLGSEEARSDVLENITALQFIFGFDVSDTSDPWKSYNPSLPSWAVQDLSIMRRRQGYIIRMSSSQNFSWTGVLKESDDISVVQGWNLVGYPSNQTKAVNTTFSSVSGLYSIIVGYDVSGNLSYPPYVWYIEGLENNSLNYTIPFQAYWINMSTSGTVHVVNS